MQTEPNAAQVTFWIIGRVLFRYKRALVQIRIQRSDTRRHTCFNELAIHLTIQKQTAKKEESELPAKVKIGELIRGGETSSRVVELAGDGVLDDGCPADGEGVCSRKKAYSDGKGDRHGEWDGDGVQAGSGEEGADEWKMEGDSSDDVER